MLDYEILAKKVEDNGMVLKHRNDLKNLKRRGQWDAQWLLDNYAAVCSKVSNLPRRMRDFVEYLGDHASAMWVQSEKAAMERIAASKPSKGDD